MRTARRSAPPILRPMFCAATFRPFGSTCRSSSATTRSHGFATACWKAKPPAVKSFLKGRCMTSRSKNPKNISSWLPLTWKMSCSMSIPTFSTTRKSPLSAVQSGRSLKKSEASSSSRATAWPSPLTGELIRAFSLRVRRSISLPSLPTPFGSMWTLPPPVRFPDSFPTSKPPRLTVIPAVYLRKPKDPAAEIWACS